MKSVVCGIRTANQQPWNFAFNKRYIREIADIQNLEISTDSTYNSKVATVDIEIMRSTQKFPSLNLYIYFACLSVWVSVCLYLINVKTAELIKPRFCVGHRHITRSGCSKFQKLPPTRFDFQ